MRGWRSEIVWVAWVAFGAAWELYTVLWGRKRHGDEPLTDLVRDRLFRLGPWGKLLRVGWLAFHTWWLLHWVLAGNPNPIPW